jgi:hypothetical protein
MHIDRKLDDLETLATTRLKSNTQVKVKEMIAQDEPRWKRNAKAVMQASFDCNRHGLRSANLLLLMFVIEALQVRF